MTRQEAHELGITCKHCTHCVENDGELLCIIEYAPPEECELCDDFISNDECIKEITKGVPIIGIDD